METSGIALHACFCVAEFYHWDSTDEPQLDLLKKFIFRRTIPCLRSSLVW
jgi:hypothetical protein